MPLPHPHPEPAGGNGRDQHAGQMELFGGPAPVEHDGMATIRPVAGGPHAGVLRVISVVQPRHGLVSRNADQTLTYRPEPDFAGTDSFDYTLVDDAGTEFSATVTVAVALEYPEEALAPDAPAHDAAEPAVADTAEGDIEIGRYGDIRVAAGE